MTKATFEKIRSVTERYWGMHDGAQALENAPANN